MVDFAPKSQNLNFDQIYMQNRLNDVTSRGSGRFWAKTLAKAVTRSRSRPKRDLFRPLFGRNPVLFRISSHKNEQIRNRTAFLRHKSQNLAKFSRSGVKTLNEQLFIKKISRRFFKSCPGKSGIFHFLRKNIFKVWPHVYFQDIL